MSNLIGSIAVSLGLDAADYVQGLTKAEYAAQKSARAIVSNLESIKHGAEAVGAALGVGFGVHEIKEWAGGILEGAEKLHNLSVETGSSIESLSKLENIVTISGGSFDDLRARLDRFAGVLSGTDEQSQKVAQVMKLLGVNARDPAQALTETAQKLNQFADGANKAALARAAYGRDGVVFLSSLKAIAEAHDIEATKTKEQIAKAVELQESFRKLTVASHELRDAFLESVVPAVTAMVTRFADAKREGNGLIETISLFVLSRKGFGEYAETVKDLGDQIEKTKKQIDDLDSGKGFFTKLDEKTGLDRFFGGINAKVDQETPDLPSAELLQRRLGVLQKAQRIADASRIRELGGAPSNERHNEGLPDAPALPDSQALKGALAAQLADVKAASDREKAILALKNEVASGAYEQNLISLKQFGDVKRQALSDQLASDTKSYEEGRKAIEKFAGTPALLPADRLGAQKDLIELTRRYTLTTIEAQKESAKLFNDDIKAAREFKNSIEELNAQVLELNGNTAEATRIRNQYQTKQQRDALGVSGETSAVANLDFANAQKTAVAALNDERTKYGRITDELSVKQARLDLLAQTGAAGEIEMYGRRAELANQYIGILQNEISREQERLLGLDKNTDAYKNGVIEIERQKLAIDQLKVSADGLKISLDNTFTGDFTKFLDDVTSGTKSVSQAFKDMGRSIAGTINHLVNEQLAKSLFKSLFGADGLTGGTTPGGALAGLLGRIGPSLAGGLASLFGGAPDFASYATGPGAPQLGGPGGNAAGTDYWRGGLTWVGERGAELVNLPKGAQVFSTRESQLMTRGGGTTVNQYITNMPGVDRRSSSQSAGELLRRGQQGARHR